MVSPSAALLSAVFGILIELLIKNLRPFRNRVSVEDIFGRREDIIDVVETSAKLEDWPTESVVFLRNRREQPAYGRGQPGLATMVHALSGVRESMRMRME